MADAWSLWRKELLEPTPEERRMDRTTDPLQMSGYWRSIGARTKHDEPVLIWTKDGAKATIFQRGERHPQNTVDHKDAWDRFVTGMGWLSCIAVKKADWDQAMKTGFWPDGKAAKELTKDQKLGIDLPAGDNAPPAEESLADQIASLAETIDAKPEPQTQDEANALSGLLDRMKRLLDLAEVERVREKEPHLTAGREVDAKWQAIGQPGGDAYRKGTAAKKAFLKREQDRLAAEARAENERRRKEAEAAAKAERERIAEETRQRLKAEEEERVSAAAALGDETPPVTLTEEEIAQRADEAAAEAVPAPVIEEVQPEKARAGSAFGRASGLKKVKKGKIVDGPLFLATLWAQDNEEVTTLAQKLANRFAKAGAKVEGMETYEDLE